MRKNESEILRSLRDTRRTASPRNGSAARPTRRGKKIVRREGLGLGLGPPQPCSVIYVVTASSEASRSRPAHPSIVRRAHNIAHGSQQQQCLSRSSLRGHTNLQLATDTSDVPTPMLLSAVSLSRAIILRGPDDWSRHEMGARRRGSDQSFSICRTPWAQESRGKAQELSRQESERTEDEFLWRWSRARDDQVHGPRSRVQSLDIHPFIHS